MPNTPDLTALQDPSLLDALTMLAVEAAKETVRFAPGDVAVRQKDDLSPVTAADEASEAVLLPGLARVMPGLPVISEESVDNASAPAEGSTFALVDPLDGTREFLAGRDEYAVCIAIVTGGVPVVGVIAAPALGLVWRGIRGKGASRIAYGEGALGAPVPVGTRQWRTESPVALVSRSHLDKDTAAWVSRIPNLTHEACGSALKFCRLAEGGADVYARLATTCEWDMAAGDALVAAAGGIVTDPEGNPLTYGKKAGNFRIPASIAFGDREMARRLVAPH
jgi:3'(2'), 5'-bisphosphate nucleotidase